MKKLAAGLALTIVAALSPLVFGQGPRAGDAEAIAAITKLENDWTKADLANDVSFFQNLLAEDYTGGLSQGSWETKQSLLADMKDTKNNKINSESISELKVRVHGDVAIATYKSTIDRTRKGQHNAKTIITTDTFQRQNSAWKLIASHSSQAAK